MWGLEAPALMFFLTTKEGYCTKCHSLTLAFTLEKSTCLARDGVDPALASRETRMTRATAFQAGQLGHPEYRTYTLVQDVGR